MFLHPGLAAKDSSGGNDCGLFVIPVLFINACSKQDLTKGSASLSFFLAIPHFDDQV